ncbi:MAG: PPC domain-containing DNA-binding protein [candidate division WOR-3 bacterium]
MDFRKSGEVIAVIMKDGESLSSNLLELSSSFKNHQILIINTALGMLKEVKLGYWNGENYEIHELNEPCELLGISGIITPSTDPPYHLHLIVGKRDGSVHGGHFIEAKVCNTIEMFLCTAEIPVERYLDGKLKKLKFRD